MRKLASLLAVLMLFNALAFAQQRTVTGTVRDAKGEPIPFATVLETGTTNAATADANGSFSIRIKEGASLTITAVGFEDITLKPGAGVAAVTMQQKGDELKEVVVTTAFGIKKAARVTPYSAQVIDAEKMKMIPQTNVNNALAGKVAGAQFRGQSPIKLNTQGSFRLRGGQGLGDTDPIYVVDGTIVGSYDINPDDIADVTVLKGANATALFGGRARNGAIVINLKKTGQSGAVGIEVNQGVTFDKVYIMPKYQNAYAGGASPYLTKFVWRPGMPEEQQALDGKYFQDYTDDASWGPRMVGQDYIPWYAWIPGHSRSYQTAQLLPQKDNMRDFWETGVTSTTNVAMTKSGTGYNARLSYTNNSVKGLLPNSQLTRHTLSGALSLDLNEHFTTGANFTFTNQQVRGTFDDGYANQSAGGLNQWFHRNLDMNMMKEYRNLRTPIGTLASWNFRANPDAGNNNIYLGNYWYNFYSWFDNINNRNKRDRVFGDAFLTYKLNNNFRVKATVRKNQLNTNWEDIKPSIIESSGDQTGELASYSTGATRMNEMNYELLASFNKKIVDKLDISVNAGSNWMHYDYRTFQMNTVNGLNVPGLYAISNSKATPTLGNTRQVEKQRAIFANGEFEWDRFASISWAIRSDYYSTSPKGNNNLVSPAFGASFVFSEFTKSSAPWLSFGKVFGSWGRKPTPLGIYDNNFLYGVNANQWNGNFLMTTPNTLVDPSVTGALITTFEAGVDLKFLKNRLGLNVVYYDELNDKGPVTVPIGPASGYTNKVVNAATIERKGIEVIIDARPVSKKDFSWDITKTFGYLMSNKVKEIYEDQAEIALAAGSFGTRFARAFQQKGKDWGQLIGGGIARNADGAPLLTVDGLFVRDQFKEWGSVVPKVTGGLVNTFSYKNVVVNFSIDYQFGGKFFSLSEAWGHFSGLMEATADVNDNGMNVRDHVGDGGGVHVVGVAAADGQTVVDTYVDAYTYFQQFYYGQIAEPFVHDLSFVKLREISVGYQIPLQKLNLSKVFKGATFSVVARNPWLIYRDSKNFDPSEISGVQGEDGQFPGTRSLGINLKLNF
ncbi:MAG: SusC/RagA family TonB-linked outer membrane protein [Chitinophagaceae bacterium]|nr:SusC/RagA family TonB-linked outer membrane protein [Chitinophagaceae bacterium]